MTYELYKPKPVTWEKLHDELHYSFIRLTIWWFGVSQRVYIALHVSMHLNGTLPLVLLLLVSGGQSSSYLKSRHLIHSQRSGSGLSRFTPTTGFQSPNSMFLCFLLLSRSLQQLDSRVQIQCFCAFCFFLHHSYDWIPKSQFDWIPESEFHALVLSAPF